MFERFGEMSSCREINELAENLLNEGDIQSLKVMAQENGIPEDYQKSSRNCRSGKRSYCDNKPECSEHRDEYGRIPDGAV